MSNNEEFIFGFDEQGNICCGKKVDENGCDKFVDVTQDVLLIVFQWFERNLNNNEYNAYEYGIHYENSDCELVMKKYQHYEDEQPSEE